MSEEEDLEEIREKANVIKVYCMKNFNKKELFKRMGIS